MLRYTVHIIIADCTVEQYNYCVYVSHLLYPPPDNEDESEGGSQGFVSLTPQMMEERSSGRSSSMGPWGALEGLPLPIKDKLLAMRELW